jgi:hypothetical protein
VDAFCSAPQRNLFWIWGCAAILCAKHAVLFVLAAPGSCTADRFPVPRLRGGTTAILFDPSSVPHLTGWLVWSSPKLKTGNFLRKLSNSALGMTVCRHVTLYVCCRGENCACGEHDKWWSSPPMSLPVCHVKLVGSPSLQYKVHMKKETSSDCQNCRLLPLRSSAWDDKHVSLGIKNFACTKTVVGLQ